MKNNSNIYDIDGKLIRPAGDTHEFTIEEAQKEIEYYKNKIEEHKDDHKTVAIYENYIKNLNIYIANLYFKNPELLESLSKQNTTDDQIKKAIEELKQEVEEDENTTKTQDDMLVEDTDRPETVMDEYVEFEEV